jgi:hypothetical protein
MFIAPNTYLSRLTEVHEPSDISYREVTQASSPDHSCIPLILKGARRPAPGCFPKPILIHL